LSCSSNFPQDHWVKRKKKIPTRHNSKAKGEKEKGKEQELSQSTKKEREKLGYTRNSDCVFIFSLLSLSHSLNKVNGHICLIKAKQL